MTRIYKRKRGLFLSVELVVVIIILALIVAIVVAGMGQLMKMYKIYRMSRDISLYSEQTTSFRNIYTYLPGDMPATELTGRLNSQNLKDGIAFIAGSAAITAASDKTFGNGKISASKSLLSFEELVTSGLVNNKGFDFSSKITSVVGASTSPNMDFIAQAGVRYPKNSADKSTIWVMGSDVLISDPFGTGMSIHKATYPGYTEEISGNPRLTLIKYTDYLTTTGVPVIDLTKPYAGLTANMTATMDVKFDDGKPFSGRYIADGINDAKGKTCTSIDGTAAPTLAQFTAATYVKNAGTDGYSGCVMSVIINN